MKFSIITPVYNGEKYITETIESVLSQEGNFEIEYILQDGGSKDRTMEIIKKYDSLLKQGVWAVRCNKITFQYFSEKDTGMYDAINKGFAKATGDIFAYINADDIYLTGAFEAIQKTFKTFPEITWLKGITSFIKDDGKIYQHGKCFLYNQTWIKQGVYGRDTYFIQQDSVFWKKELWNKTAGINPHYKLAGDYFLWIQFAKHSPLWSLNKEVSCFRKRAGQLSINSVSYREEQREISKRDNLLTWAIAIFFYLRARKQRRPKLTDPIFTFIYNLAFGNENPYGIEIGKNGVPTKRRATSYTLN